MQNTCEESRQELFQRIFWATCRRLLQKNAKFSEFLRN